jgi:opacity protein-like surface antigen
MTRKIFGALTLAALFGLTAFAQDVPKTDLFIGYSFLRANSAQSIPAFTAQGGVATFGYNFNNHVGVEAEFGGYHNGNVNDKHFDSTSYSYLFGPRISYGRSKKIDPYIHALVGVNRATTSILASSTLLPTPVQPVAGQVGPRLEASQANFAMAIGGGIDVKLSKRVTFRPAQIDYYMTRFETPTFLRTSLDAITSNKNQNDFRFAAGILFTFGSK